MSDRELGLTRRGWTAAGAAAGLLLGGRLLGADELSILGVAVFGILVGALAWVSLTRAALQVTRRLDPARLHVDDAARIDLAVTTARPTPLVDLTEAIDGGRLRARFLLAPLHPGTTADPAYRLPTDRRGPLVLGPTTTVRTDPLGLAQRRRVVAPAEIVLVRPRVFPIAAPALGAGRRLAAEDSESPRAPVADAGSEFLAVRPYEVGDDPRRVHWRSSARTDDLMVRQFVSPRRGHTVVVLDTRAPGPGAPEPDADLPRDGDVGPTSPAFERAVEAAASVVAALHRARRPVECITTSGAVIAHVGGDPQRTMDRLATVMMDEPDLLDAVARTRRHQPPELVVLVTARNDARVQAARRVLARRSPSLLVVTGGAGPEAATTGAVVDARTVAFPDAWRAAHPVHRAHRPHPVLPGRAPLAPVPWNSAAPSPRPSPSPR